VLFVLYNEIVTISLKTHDGRIHTGKYPDPDPDPDPDPLIGDHELMM
jgi:hypothetical protein